MPHKKNAPLPPLADKDYDDHEEHEGYEVGYGKPPKHSQFKPGQSGNPNGRPKREVDLHAEVQKVLNQKLVIVEKGKKRTITKREAMLMHVANQGAGKGDLRAIKYMVDLERELERDQQRKLSALASPSSTSVNYEGEDADIDFDGMSAEDMEHVFESAQILEEHQKKRQGTAPPGTPMPPTGRWKKT
jgi:hypothetical protein